jgi:hypothetical protein
MTRDKQLSNISLDEVIEKRRLDQALNAKEFAVLAGVSYSTARAWFRQEGFPSVSGVVFWQDFVQWRKAQAGVKLGDGEKAPVDSRDKSASDTRRVVFTGKAAKILAEVG